LHTIDASKTVDRIIGVFPKNEEPTIRTRLSQSFRFIVSQRLIPRQDGKGRVAAIEILKSTMRTKEYIEKGERDGKSLLDAIRDGELEGMQSFDQVLERYVRDGSIALQTALEYATNRNNLSLALRDWEEAQRKTKPPTPNSGGPSIQIEKY
jgi:twitching motility protein PilT